METRCGINLAEIPYHKERAVTCLLLPTNKIFYEIQCRRECVSKILKVSVSDTDQFAGAKQTTLLKFYHQIHHGNAVSCCRTAIVDKNPLKWPLTAVLRTSITLL